MMWTRVGEPLGLVHVVRGEHDRDAVVAQLLEQLPDGAADAGVEAGGGLVDEHQLGAADQRHRQAEPLLLAAGEPAVRRAAAVAEAEPLDQQPDVERVGVQPGDVAQHLDRPDAAPRAAALEHHADAGEQRRAARAPGRGRAPAPSRAAARR